LVPGEPIEHRHPSRTVALPHPRRRSKCRVTRRTARIGDTSTSRACDPVPAPATVGEVAMGSHRKGDSMSKNRWKLGTALVGAFAIGVLAASVVWAAGGVSRVGGGAITRVAIARGSTSTGSMGTSWNNVPNANVKITIPSGHHAILLATFSSETICAGGSV